MQGHRARSPCSVVTTSTPSAHYQHTQTFNWLLLRCPLLSLQPPWYLLAPFPHRTDHHCCQHLQPVPQVHLPAGPPLVPPLACPATSCLPCHLLPALQDGTKIRLLGLSVVRHFQYADHPAGSEVHSCWWMLGCSLAVVSASIEDAPGWLTSARLHRPAGTAQDLPLVLALQHLQPLKLLSGDCPTVGGMQQH